MPLVTPAVFTVLVTITVYDPASNEVTLVIVKYALPRLNGTTVTVPRRHRNPNGPVPVTATSKVTVSPATAA